MSLDFWFPTVIYRHDLTPPKDVESGIKKYFDDLTEKLSHIKNKPTGVTGDVIIEYKLYDHPSFSWLNNEVGFHCQRYIESLGGDISKYRISASKSWPVICYNGGVIKRHNHRNSCLSAVYYVQSPTDTSGYIKFIASHSEMDFLPLSYKKCEFINSTEAIYKPVEKRLIIFPSSLMHEVLPYMGEQLRYSVSYDIMVTVQDDVNVEHCITDPTTWRDLL